MAGVVAYSLMTVCLLMTFGALMAGCVFRATEDGAQKHETGYAHNHDDARLCGASGPAAEPIYNGSALGATEVAAVFARGLAAEGRDPYSYRRMINEAVTASRAESGWYTCATNVCGVLGLWQIDWVHYDGVDDNLCQDLVADFYHPEADLCADPVKNARCAIRIHFRDNGWSDGWSALHSRGVALQWADDADVPIPSNLSGEDDMGWEEGWELGITLGDDEDEGDDEDPYEDEGDDGLVSGWEGFPTPLETPPQPAPIGYDPDGTSNLDPPPPSDTASGQVDGSGVISGGGGVDPCANPDKYCSGHPNHCFGCSDGVNYKCLVARGDYGATGWYREAETCPPTF